MKAVLISINPIWCEGIASGKKKVEIRKTKPKLGTPFRCFIYETKGITDTPWVDEDGHLIFQGRGAVIGEFVCYNIVPVEVLWNGHIKNWLYYELKDSCVPYEEMAKYIGCGKTGYGWKIAELKIYEKPKPLSEFQLACNHKEDCCTCKRWSVKNFACIAGITRAPQSWCYVEV